MMVISQLKDDMTRKTDRRVLRTRKAIKEAFDRLLAQQALDKITVSAIAREADIDRKTFYLHYGTIDDLVQDVAADNMREIEAFLKERGEGKSVEECVHLTIQLINETLLSDLKKYEKIASNLSLEQIIERIEKSSGILLEAIEPHIDASLHVQDAAQRHMQLRFYLAGALSLYTEWLNSDHKLPLENVSHVVEDILTANLFTSKPVPSTATPE